MSHWATGYIGISWEYGAQGPDSYDCWNFVRHVQKTRFSIDVPVILYTDQRDVSHQLQHNAELDRWTQTDSPIEGDIVMMARAKIPAHVGVWIKANGHEGILHCLQHVGVVFTRENAIRSHGWGQLKFYRRKDE